MKLESYFLRTTLKILGGLALLFLSWSFLPLSFPEHLSSNVAVKILDRHGEVISNRPSAAGIRSSALPLDKFSPELKSLIILSEDRRFYSHSGVDLLALLRALYTNLRMGRVSSGASTITMQTVRLAWQLKRTLPAKLQQLFLAWRLENSYSKDDILEFYLNHVPFGGNLAGFPMACSFYYGAECHRLSLAELSALTVLIRAPNRLAGQSEQLKAKRDRLLKAYAADQRVSERELKLALDEPLKVEFKTPDFYAPHFIAWVLSNSTGQEQKIATTLDMTLQRRLQRVMRRQVRLLKKHNVTAAAALVVKNRTGEILAYIGSPDYFDDENSGKFDYTRARRQPGSTLKPFTYALALENSYHLSSILPDLPLVLDTSAGPFRPKNYSGRFTGPRRIRAALANSLNIPALYLADQLGAHALLNWYRRMGFHSLTADAAHYGIGVTLGNGEVSLHELVGAYSIFAREGRYLPLKYLQNEAVGSGEKVMSEKSAYLISDVLSDPIAREAEFGRYNPLVFDYRVGAKTGTSSSFRDNWVIGFSGQLTVGVWVGNHSGQPLKNVTGITGAGPIFHEIMALSMKSRFNQPVEPPPGIVTRRICPLSGQLAGKHCDSAITEKFSDDNHPTSICEMHRELTVDNCNSGRRRLVYVDYPALYAEWANDNATHDLNRILRAECKNSQVALRSTGVEIKSEVTGDILEPLDGSVFALDPNIPTEHQRLPIRLLTPPHCNEVVVMVNGQRKNISNYKPGAYLWTMERGQHQITARFKCEDETIYEADPVKIIVK